MSPSDRWMSVSTRRSRVVSRIWC